MLTHCQTDSQDQTSGGRNNKFSFNKMRGEMSSILFRHYVEKSCFSAIFHIDGLVQERRNSIANALELRLSCTNPSISCRHSLPVSATWCKLYVCDLCKICFHFISRSWNCIIFICVSRGHLPRLSTLVPHKRVFVVPSYLQVMWSRIIQTGGWVTPQPLRDVTAISKYFFQTHFAEKFLGHPLIVKMFLNECKNRISSIRGQHWLG